MTLSIYSCGNKPETAQEEPKKTEDTTAAKPPAAPVFIPFQVMVIYQTVADYPKWRSAYDAHDSVRKAAGLAELGVERNLDNANTVLVAHRVSDITKAKDFSSSPELKKAMEKAGVVGKPTIYFFQVLRMDSSKVDSKERIIVTHRVKDFDAWLKVFDSEGKAARAAQGMVDRVLARGVDDPNVVHVVFSVTDMAKAKASMFSEDKKKLMMSAGVEGKPDIGFYKNED